MSIDDIRPGSITGEPEPKPALAGVKPTPHVEVWHDTGALCAIATQFCDCGETHRTFAGFFRMFTNRTGATRRVRVLEKPQTFKVWTLAPECVPYCGTCLGVGDSALDAILAHPFEARQQELWQ